MNDVGGIYARIQEALRIGADLELIAVAIGLHTGICGTFYQ
jgi:hypothetical protein